jgi:hypothetical protein
MMTMGFITIAEAARLTGRHEKTIRRWIRKQLEKDPQARDKIVRDTIASGFTYRVDKDYLLANSPPLDTPEQSSQEATGQGTVHQAEQSTGQPIHPPDPLMAAKDEVITLLKDQVRQQQEELSSKNEQIKTVLERLREQNILLKGYQEKYLLNAPKPQGDEGSPLDTPEQSSQEATGQGTVLPPEQGRQANPANAGTNHKRKEPAARQKGENFPSKQSEKKAIKSEQHKKKGFFSFLRGK